MTLMYYTWDQVICSLNFYTVRTIITTDFNGEPRTSTRSGPTTRNRDRHAEWGAAAQKPTFTGERAPALAPDLLFSSTDRLD